MTDTNKKSTDAFFDSYHDQRARLKQLQKSQEGESVTVTVQTVHGVKQNVKFGTSRKQKRRVNDLYTLIDKVVGWHYDRNLIEGSTDKDQTLKLLQELGELSDSVCKGQDIKDDIGDMLVVMINIVERNGLVLSECLKKAWDDIKDRKGRMQDGIFIKSSSDSVE